MSEFWMVEEFQRFLESLEREDPGFVKQEMHYFAENSRAKSVGIHTNLYPLFLNPKITKMYRRFSKLVWNAVEDVVEVVGNPSHEQASEMRDFLNIDNVLSQLLTYKPKGGRMPRIIRPDTVFSEGRIQAHEVNVSWPGGLMRTDVMLETLQENVLYRRFKEEMKNKGFHISRPKKHYNSSLVLDQLVDASGKEKPYIVIIVPQDPLQVPIHTWFRDYVRERGFDCDLIHPPDFQYDGQQATVDGRPIDVAYRIFEWHHVLGDEKNEGYRRVVQAELNGLAVVNTFASELVSAKSLFEVLWDDRFRQCFDEAELDELREYIPRTANLSRVPDDVVKDVLENKDRWVLKPVKGSCGRGVYVGKMVHGPRGSLEDWRRTVEQGRANGSYIAQEYVESPTIEMAVVRGDRLMQIKHYPDLNPPIVGGAMGHLAGRCSPSLFTAMWGPDHGGIYPILTHDNPKPRRE